MSGENKTLEQWLDDVAPQGESYGQFHVGISREEGGMVLYFVAAVPHDGSVSARYCLRGNHLKAVEPK